MVRRFNKQGGDMKIEIIERKVYDITANGVTIKALIVDSEWEFFVKLKNTIGESIIIAKEDFTKQQKNPFLEIFEPERQKKDYAVIVGGTERLIEQLKSKDN